MFSSGRFQVVVSGVQGDLCMEIFGSRQVPVRTGGPVECDCLGDGVFRSVFVVDDEELAPDAMVSVLAYLVHRFGVSPDAALLALRRLPIYLGAGECRVVVEGGLECDRDWWRATWLRVIK